MIINKNIEKDTYLKLVYYAFQKCDSIFLIKRNDQHKLSTNKIMGIIMQTNQYTENDIVNMYTENSKKFLEEMVSQFIDNDTIFEEDGWKENLVKLGMDSEQIEKCKIDNRFHMIESSITRFVYEHLTYSWIGKHQNSIISEKNRYLPLKYISNKAMYDEQFLYTTTYYIRLANEIKAELINKNSIYDWCFPMALEDLCFFKDGYCWLYSVAHEEILDIYCENEEEYNYLKSIGIEFEEDHFIPISEKEKKDLYYKNFNNN